MPFPFLRDRHQYGSVLECCRTLPALRAVLQAGVNLEARSPSRDYPFKNTYNALCQWLQDESADTPAMIKALIDAKADVNYRPPVRALFVYARWISGLCVCLLIKTCLDTIRCPRVHSPQTHSLH